MNKSIGLTVLLGCVTLAAVALVLRPQAETSQPTAPSQPAPQPSQAKSQAVRSASLDWRETLDRVLAEPADPSAARTLFEAMPGLPVDALEQYLPHALDLCADGQFPLAEEIYFRQGMPRFVYEAIFEDALNRPDEIKLPLMARTAASPKHPMNPEARSLLESYLKLEQGAAPQETWEVAVGKYLAEQASP